MWKRQPGNITFGNETARWEFSKCDATRELFGILEVLRRQRDGGSRSYFDFKILGDSPEVISLEEGNHPFRHELLVTLPVRQRYSLFRGCGGWNLTRGVVRIIRMAN